MHTHTQDTHSPMSLVLLMLWKTANNFEEEVCPCLIQHHPPVSQPETQKNKSLFGWVKSNKYQRWNSRFNQNKKNRYVILPNPPNKLKLLMSEIIIQIIIVCISTCIRTKPNLLHFMYNCVTLFAILSRLCVLSVTTTDHSRGRHVLCILCLEIIPHLWTFTSEKIHVQYECVCGRKNSSSRSQQLRSWFRRHNNCISCVHADDKGDLLSWNRWWKTESTEEIRDFESTWVEQSK